MLLVLATLQEYVRMVAVETVGQLTLEVPRPEGSSREQLEDSVSTLTFLLVKIWVTCSCALCFLETYCTACAKWRRHKRSLVRLLREDPSQEVNFSKMVKLCLFFLLGVVWRLDLPFCKKNTGTFWAGSRVPFRANLALGPRKANFGSTVLFLKFLLIH